MKTIQIIASIILMIFPSLITTLLIVDNYKWESNTIVFMTYLSIIGWVAGGLILNSIRIKA